MEGFLFGFQFNTALGRLLFHNTCGIMALPKEDCKDKNMDLISNLIALHIYQIQYQSCKKAAELVI